jgi:hypothetical protein
MVPRPAVLLLSAPLLVATACREPAAPRAGWPDGTALAVGGVPVPAEEIERAASRIALIEPGVTPLQLRRLALGNEVFPRCAARILAGARRAEALARARERRARIAAREDDARDASLASGGWKELGLACWAAALEAGPERWSDVVESPGAFHLVRLKGSSDEGARVLTIERIDFAYLAPDVDQVELEAALEGARLEIVDEGWREAVPLRWMYRMDTGGEPP